MNGLAAASVRKMRWRAEPLELFSKDSKNHGFHIRWLLISLWVPTEKIRDFDLLKSFGYIERVVKSYFFVEKANFTIYLWDIY